MKKNPKDASSPNPGRPSGRGDDDEEETTARARELKEKPTEDLSAEELEGAGSTVNAPEDTEDVLVILPEDADGSNLPVVETMVVEDQAWESGSTATDVLKDVPADLEGGKSLQDVPLVKSNPLNADAGEEETESQPITDRLGAEPEPEAEEEVKVIDEIADIAADLEHEEPLLDETRSGAHIPRAVAPIGSAGSRKTRLVAVVTSMAALVLVGVFFYPELDRLYWRYLGGGQDGESPPGQAHAGGGATPATAGGDEGGAARARDELRARVHLALEVGLRGDAGKD